MLTEILSGTIPPRIQVLAVLGSVFLLTVIIQLIRREKLKEGYSIIWFVVGLAMVVFSTLAGLLDIFARSVGISYSPAALFLILTGGLLLLSIHFSVLVSKHDQRFRELAQEYALLRTEMEEQFRAKRLRPEFESRLPAPEKQPQGEPLRERYPG